MISLCLGFLVYKTQGLRGFGELSCMMHSVISNAQYSGAVKMMMMITSSYLEVVSPAEENIRLGVTCLRL